MAKRGRPKNPVSPYTMTIHKNGKYRYASTQRPVEDEDGNVEYRHFHWGSLDANNVFHPNHVFLYLPTDEKNKFIFPDEWNLRELDLYHNPIPVPTTQSVVAVEKNVITVAQSRTYGAVWLLERLGDQLGVREDLMTTFCQNQVIVDDIMTVAMFLYITNYNLDRLEEWQRLEKYPSSRPEV